MKDSALDHVLARWKREYAAHYGTPYLPAGGDRKHLGALLREFRDRVAIEAFDWESLFLRYLGDADAWLARQRHPLGWLACNVNRYTGERAVSMSPGTQRMVDAVKRGMA